MKRVSSNENKKIVIRLYRSIVSKGWMESLLPKKKFYSKNSSSDDHELTSNLYLVFMIIHNWKFPFPSPTINSSLSWIYIIYKIIGTSINILLSIPVVANNHDYYAHNQLCVDKLLTVEEYKLLWISRDSSYLHPVVKHCEAGMNNSISWAIPFE